MCNKSCHCICISAQSYVRTLALCLQSREDLRGAEQAEKQLSQLQQQLDSAKRQEEAAKAVLSAQRNAGRNGEVLSRNDVRAISQPILNPSSEEGEEVGAGAGGGGGFLGSLLGGGAKRAGEEAEEAAEEVPSIAAALPICCVVSTHCL